MGCKLQIAVVGVMTLLPNFLLGQQPPACDGVKLTAEAVREIIGTWESVGFGTKDHEEVVLIIRGRYGRLRARKGIVTFGYQSAKFEWNPRIVAIFHTHPNSSPREPTGNDQAVAKRLRVPIFTLTSRGVWGFDPTTRKTECLMDALDWLDPENWKGVTIPIARLKK